MLWIVLTGLFLLFRLMPGDFTAQMTQSGASPEVVQAVRERWGLDEPLHVQYIEYMKNLALLDLGQSHQYGVPVWEFVRGRIFNTFILVAPAITLGYVFGSILGAIFGTNRGSNIEKWGIVPIVFLGSFPSFFIAIVFIIVFAGWLNWFPTSGMISPSVYQESDSWWGPYFTSNFVWHYTLPFLCVFTRYLYMPSLIMRTSVVEVTGQDFIEYHRLTGLPMVNRMAHIAKHSILPVITIYPISMSRALGGLVLIEMVFNWPGIGYTLVTAVFSRDIPVVMFIFFIVATFIIIANFIIDIIYGIIDPRVSLDD